jgi:catechol 1,2-dioxygenase
VEEAMRNCTYDNITDLVIAAISPDVSPRVQAVMSSLIRHLHAFAKDVNLTTEEWLAACEYFVRTGHKSDHRRNEFILLSDIIGLEVLVDMMDHQITAGETESTVIGPFYRENAPVYPKGASIVQKLADGAETVYVEGYVKDASGAPIKGATIDVWHTNSNGLYEQQDEDQPDMNLRGRFQSDEGGHYAFRCLRPVSYPIPDDGPGGELLRLMGRHPMRPAHIHFILSAPGMEPIVTQIYDSTDEYLDNDSVFAVKQSLVNVFEKAPKGADTDFVLRQDWTLKPAAGAPTISNAA